MLAWDELLATKNLAPLAALARTLVDVSINDANERFEKLLHCPPDPRVDSAMVQWLWSVPYSSSSAKKFWNAVFKKLNTTNDARQLERIKGLPDRFREKWQTQAGQWATEKAEALVLACQPRLEKLAALEPTKQEAELLSPFLATFSSDAKLEDLVLAALLHPDQDSFRFAYAEAAGGEDPRASLIRLQSLPNPSFAEKKEIEVLVKTHADSLVGPLAQFIKKPKFRLGFLSECFLGTKIPADVLQSPYWNTLESANIGHNSSPLTRAFPTLKSLSGLLLWRENYPDNLKIDQIAPCPTLEFLNATVWSMEHLTSILNAEKQFPKVNHLRFWDLPARWAESDTIDGPLWQQLEELSWEFRSRGKNNGFKPNMHWILRFLNAVGPKMKVVEVDGEYGTSNCRYSFERAKEGWKLSLSTSVVEWAEVLFEDVQYLLANLPEHFLVRFSAQTRRKVTQGWKEGLTKAIAIASRSLTVDLSKVKV